MYNIIRPINAKLRIFESHEIVFFPLILTNKIIEFTNKKASKHKRKREILFTITHNVNIIRNKTNKISILQNIKSFKIFFFFPVVS